MPISKDPTLKARQLSNLTPYRTRDGWRSTKPMRVQLPEGLAARYEALSAKERTAVIIAGLESAIAPF